MTTNELTDEQYDIADAILEYINKHQDRDYNASQLARAAKCTTGDAYTVLNWLVAENEVLVTGRGGAWRRYAFRPFGRYNAGTV